VLTITSICKKIIYPNIFLIPLLSTWTNNVWDSRECSGTLIFLTILLVHVNKNEIRIKWECTTKHFSFCKTGDSWKTRHVVHNYFSFEFSVSRVFVLIRNLLWGIKIGTLPTFVCISYAHTLDSRMHDCGLWCPRIQTTDSSREQHSLAHESQERPLIIHYSMTPSKQCMTPH